MPDLKKLIVRYARSRTTDRQAGPLLVELLQPTEGEALESYEKGPFNYAVKEKKKGRKVSLKRSCSTS